MRFTLIPPDKKPRTFERKNFMRIKSTTIATLGIACMAFFAIQFRATAQYSERYIPISYLGVELNGGTRMFSLKSDIPQLNNLRITEEGFNAAIFAGSEVAVGKLKYGFYRSAKAVREKIEMQEGELSINAFPLYLFKVKSKLIKPYAVASLDISNLKFFGNYALPKKAALPKPPVDCECLANPDMPGCSEEVVEEPAGPAPPEDPDSGERLLGRVVVTKFDFGCGVWVHIPKRNNFINMFAEAKYGLPAGTKAKDKAFAETKVTSGFVMVNIGVNFGLRN